LITYCESHKIAVEAYSPLTHGRKLDHPSLRKIADKFNKSMAQILIRWGLQHGFIEIPKSSQKEHIIENSKVFDFKLNMDDMKTLDNIGEKFQLLYDTSKWD
jgi:diketogulonate reductase-like aldo/keto reductase